MASFPSAVNNLKPFEAPDPLEIMGKATQLRNMQQQGQLGAENLKAAGMENQQRQMDLEDQQKIRQAFMQANGNIDQTIDLAAKLGVKPQMLLSLKNAAIEQHTSVAKLTKIQQENTSAQLGILGQHAQAMLSTPPEQKQAMWEQSVGELVRQGIADPKQMPAQYPGDDYVRFRALEATSAKDQIDQRLKQQEFDVKQPGMAAESETKVRQNLAAKLGNAQTQEQYAQLWGEAPAKYAQAFPHPTQWKPDSRDAILQVGMTPHEVASVPFEKQVASDWLKKNPGKTVADFNEYNKKIVPAFSLNLQANQLDDAAVDMAARTFATTGQIPPNLGRNGMQASKIMNRAAQLFPQLDPAANKAEYQANARSLEGLQKQLDSVTAFENTANKNLDLLIQQAQRVVDSGNPMINTPLRLVSKQMGGTDVPAYEAAQQVAVNEVAKVTSNPGLMGALSDSARHEVEAFNPKNATLAQTLAVAKVLKQDMQNRHQSYDEQIQAIKQRIGGTQKQPGAQQPAAGAQQPQASGAGTQGGGFDWGTLPKVK